MNFMSVTFSYILKTLSVHLFILLTKLFCTTFEIVWSLIYVPQCCHFPCYFGTAVNWCPMTVRMSRGADCVFHGTSFRTWSSHSRVLSVINMDKTFKHFLLPFLFSEHKPLIWLCGKGKDNWRCLTKPNYRAFSFLCMRAVVDYSS